MLLLKLIFFFLIAYYVISFVARLALPYFVRFLVRKTVTEAQRRASGYTSNSEQYKGNRDSAASSASANGDYSTAAGSPNSNKRFKGGDYIDYEDS